MLFLKLSYDPIEAGDAGTGVPGEESGGVRWIRTIDERLMRPLRYHYAIAPWLVAIAGIEPATSRLSVECSAH
jgi:hypothetical protein